MCGRVSKGFILLITDTIKICTAVNKEIAKNASGTAVPEALVRVARFERAASCSQGKRPTPGLHPDFIKFYTKNCNCGISCGRPPVSGVFKAARSAEKSPCVRPFREDAGMS